MTGVVGAIFNSGLQLGSAVGVAVDASIETSIENQESDGQGFFHYKGRRATFWWLFACNVALAVSIFFFYRTDVEITDSQIEQEEQEADASESESGKTGSVEEIPAGSLEGQEKASALEEAPSTRMSLSEETR